MSPQSPASSALKIDVGEEGNQLTLHGSLDIRNLVEAKESLGRLLGKSKSAALDLHDLSSLDTPGALFLCALRDKGVALNGVRAEHKALLDLIGGLELKPLPEPKPASRARQLVIQLGKVRTTPGMTRSISLPLLDARRVSSAMPLSTRVRYAWLRFLTTSRNRYRGTADRRADGRYDQHRHRLSERCPVASLWRRGVHRQSGGGVGFA